MSLRNYWYCKRQIFDILLILILLILIEKHICPRPPTAILAFKWTIAHPSPSVFHADQRGMRGFLIWTFWPEFWQAILAPMGIPSISNTRDCFWSILLKKEVVRNGKISHLKPFPDPLDIWVRLWSHPQPHGGPQLQQQQGLFWEHSS